MTPESFEFGQVEKLTDRLSELVRKYPKGVGIFKEFLQNADDAGAKSLKVFLDLRTFPSENLPDPAMSVLQGPALVFVNDQPFSQEDWAKIQEIGNSGKAMNVAKTGRFGLGFNSVYNVTDYPMLLTNDNLAVFDPHFDIVTSSSRKPGKGWKLKSLWDGSSDVLAPFEDFGLSKGQPSFGATIFRLPLRDAKMAARSEIFSEPFDPKDFAKIVNTVEAHASGLLLFTNCVQSFQVSTIHEDGVIEQVLSLETVNEAEITGTRDQLRNLLAYSNDEVLEQLKENGSTDWLYSHQIQILSAQDKRVEHWSVVRGLYGDEELIDAAADMVDVGEKAIPMAGAALQLEAPTVHGQLSCALPLPTFSGTPLHIDGFFDLEDSRQDIHQDSETAGKTGAVRHAWNEQLLRNGCAKAAAKLLTHVGELSGAPAYDHWPTIPSALNRMVDSLPEMIYEALIDQNCISIRHNKEFVSPACPINPPPKLSEPLLEEGFAIPNPQIPGNVLKGFKQIGSPIAGLTPSELRDLLREKPFEDCKHQASNLPSLRNKEWLFGILDFCLSDKRFEDFNDVPLALMADGSLRKFGRQRSQRLYTGTRTERDLLAGLPHLFLADEMLERDADRLPNVVSMNLNCLVEQLPSLFQSLDGEACIEAHGNSSAIPSYQWLENFYTYCTDFSKTSNVRKMPCLPILKTLPLVPDRFGCLFGMGLPSTPVFETERRLSTWKLELLSSAGISTVSTAGDLGKAISKFKSEFRGDEIPDFSPQMLIECLSQNPGTALALLTSNRKFVGEVLTYFAKHNDWKSRSQTLEMLKHLPIFPLVGGGLTSLAGSDTYVSSGFQPPDISFDVRLLDTANGNLDSLYKTFNVRPLTRARYVLDFVLDGFGNIKSVDQLAALEWFRSIYFSLMSEIEEKYRKPFAQKVRETKLVVCDDGELHAPNEIYHPDCKEIATLLGNAAHCPDMAVYVTEDWLEFFVTLGMEQNARPKDVIQAIDNLVAEPFNENVVSRLQRLVEFIEKNWDDFRDKMADQEWFAEALGKRKWLPAISRCPSNYPSSLFKVPTANLYSPADLSRRKDLDFVGSSNPICRFPIQDRMAKSIGLVPPELGAVLLQFENVVRFLQNGTVDKQSARILRSIYWFAGRSLGDPNCAVSAAEISDKYHAIKCLIDISDKLWAPRDCFESQVSFFSGLRKQIQFDSEHEERFATALGRNRDPGTDDFRRFFSDLEKALGGAEIPMANRDRIRRAYLRATEIGSANEFSTCPVPAKSGYLLPRSSVLFNDAPWLGERAAKAGVELLDDNLGYEVAVAFGVGQLSTVVSERIESFVECNEGVIFERCDSLNTSIQSAEFAKGLVRLLTPCDQDRFQIDLLRKFRVVPSSDIQTSLYWEGDLIEDSLGDTEVIYDDNLLYTTTTFSSLLVNQVASALSERIFADLEFLHENCIPMMLSESPSDIKLLLDKARVPDFPVGKTFEFLDETNDEETHSELEMDEGSFLEVTGESTDTNTAPIAETAFKPTDGSTSTAVVPTQQSPRSSASQHHTDGAKNNKTHGDDATNSPATGDEAEYDNSTKGESTDQPPPRPQNSEVKKDAAEKSSRDSNAEIAEPASERSKEATDGAEVDHAASHGEFTENGRAGSGAPRPRGSQPRNRTEPKPRRHRAVSYVEGNEQKSPENPETRVHRNKVDAAAVEAVRAFEATTRDPEVKEPFNRGYDVESCSKDDGSVERFIEVKGLSGAWSDFGVKLTPAQIHFGNEKGDAHWLYVVEFALDPGRLTIHAIQNPVSRITDYRFDAGWKQFCTETIGVETRKPTIGARVVVDGVEKGEIVEMKTFGETMRLTIRLDDESKKKINYPSNRVSFED